MARWEVPGIRKWSSTTPFRHNLPLTDSLNPCLHPCQAHSRQSKSNRDHPVAGVQHFAASAPFPAEEPAQGWSRIAIPDILVERRTRPRYPMVLAAEVVELPPRVRSRHGVFHSVAFTVG